MSPETLSLSWCLGGGQGGDSGGANTSASKSSIRRFIITEKAPTRSLNMKLSPRHNYHKGWAALGHYANQAAH